jgi:hypothetical protein
MDSKVQSSNKEKIMSTTTIVSKLQAAIETSSLEHASRRGVDFGQVSTAAEAATMLTFSHVGSDYPIDTGADLQAICAAAGVQVVDSAMIEGVEYLAVTPVESEDGASLVGDRARACAASWDMWSEYIDPDAAFTREEFDTMDIERREQLAQEVISSNA